MNPPTSMPFQDDTGVWPTMIALRDCLIEEIEKSGLPPVCYAEVMPGALAPFDYADEGQAWVRLATAFPSVNFPNQNTDSRRSCGSPLAYQLEVGIIRCVPKMHDVRTPPTAEEEFEATRLQLADMAAMRRAIFCCLGKRDAVLTSYTPTGPDTGAIGGTWLVYVGTE